MSNNYKSLYNQYKTDYKQTKYIQLGGSKLSNLSLSFYNNTKNAKMSFDSNQINHIYEKNNYGQIIRDLIELYKKYQNINIETSPFSLSDANKLFKLNGTIFIDKEIYDSEIKTNKFHQITNLNDHFKYFVYAGEFNKMFLLRSLVFVSYFKFKNFKPSICYIPTSFKKEIPTDKNYIDIINVNSGYAITYDFSVIFRNEEAKKVLLHELIHQYEYDQYNETDSHEFKYHNENKTKKISLLLNESLTEILGLIYNIIFCIAEIGMHKNLSDSEIKNMFNLFYIIELKFSLCQVAKLLHFYKIDNITKLIHSPINTTTAILEYYVFKTVILYNIKEYHHTFTNSLIINVKRKYNMKEFYNFIKNKLYDNNFINDVSYSQNNRCLATNTLRMTTIESNL